MKYILSLTNVRLFADQKCIVFISDAVKMRGNVNIYLVSPFYSAPLTFSRKKKRRKVSLEPWLNWKLLCCCANDPQHLLTKWWWDVCNPSPVSLNTLLWPAVQHLLETCHCFLFFFFIVEPFIKTWFSSQIKMELTAEVKRSPVNPRRSPLERWAEMGAEQPGHNNEGHQLVWRTASAHSHLINGLLQWQNRSKRRRSKAPWGSTGGFCHNTPPSQNALSFSPQIDLLTEWTFLRNRNRFA